MDNLNSAIKRIKNKKQVKEAVQIIPAIAKGVAVAGKVAAKVAAAGTKAAAKGGIVAAKAAKTGAKAAKTGAKATGDAAKSAAKATKPASKNLKFKRPNIRSYKDSKTGKVDLDKYRSDQSKYKKIQQDKKDRPDMSNVEPDGPSDDRTKRGERKLKAIDKVTDKKKESIKQGLQTTGDVAKKTAQVAGDTANYARKKVKSAVSSTSGAFGTSSFNKESKITFQQFIDKTP